MRLSFLMCLLAGHAFAQNAAWNRILPGQAPPAAPYAGWPEDDAGRMRQLTTRFCGNLRLVLRELEFPFANDAACIARQESLLPGFCDAQGRSLRRPASRCYSSVNTEMRAGLNRLSERQLGSTTPSWAPDAQRPPAPPPPMTRVLPPDQVFIRAQQAIWVVRVAAGGPGRGGALGSAVAIGPRHLLTNCHVVQRGESITIHRGAERLPARIAAADPEGDRCVLQTQNAVLRPIGGLRPAAELSIGERLYAIGAPLGLDLTLTEGILSARRRRGAQEILQSTAPTSPGSSGGGLFDARGNLVGITTAGAGRSESLNFALAADSFWSLAPGDRR